MGRRLEWTTRYRSTRPEGVHHSGRDTTLVARSEAAVERLGPNGFRPNSVAVR